MLDDRKTAILSAVVQEYITTAQPVGSSHIAAATGIGPGDWVVLARAQLAVAVLGFDAAAEPDATLKFKPRVALVAETHTSEWRVRGVAEKLVPRSSYFKFAIDKISHTT